MIKTCTVDLFKRIFLLALLALGCVSGAMAQAYPSRPVRIVIPFPPGGGIDVLMRAIAGPLSQRWRQPIIIDNKSGAGSLLGAQAVARANPDGYTLLATVNQTMTGNRFLYKSLPYDPERSFAPITLMVRSDQFVLANASIQAKDLRELSVLARRSELNYGSFGNGSQPHLIFEGLKRRERLQIMHVPYKGVAPLLQALTAGEVELGMGSAGVAGPLMQAGKIKPIAIAGPQRSPQFPDVLTTAEQGYPELVASIWYGLFAPAGTPAKVLERIGNDVRAVLADPVFARQHAQEKGLDVVAGSADELAEVIKEESRIVGSLIRTAGVKPE